MSRMETPNAASGLGTSSQAVTMYETPRMGQPLPSAAVMGNRTDTATFFIVSRLVREIDP